MAEPAAARQPEPGEGPVAMALRWLHTVVAQRAPGVELRSEVFDRVSLRLARALQRGVRMRSPHAFLANALRYEVAKSKRDPGRRTRLLPTSGQDVADIAAVGAGGELVETQIQKVLQALSAGVQGQVQAGRYCLESEIQCHQELEGIC